MFIFWCGSYSRSVQEFDNKPTCVQRSFNHWTNRSMIKVIYVKRYIKKKGGESAGESKPVQLLLPHPTVECVKCD